MFYADVFLLQNLFLDYVAVLGTNCLLKRGKSKRRLFAVSLLSGITGLAAVLLLKDWMLYQILTHFILNTGMVLLCFGAEGRKSFLENWVVTYFMVVLLGGGLEWLRETGLFAHDFLLQALIASALLFTAVSYVGAFRSFGKHMFPAELRKDCRSIKLRAYWDSGCQLKDPYTGKEISILSGAKAKEFLEESKDKLRLVPYRSLGEEHGLLAVTEIDELSVCMGGRSVCVKNTEIGIAGDGLLKDKEYDLILHAALIRSEGERRHVRRKKKTQRNEIEAG